MDIVTITGWAAAALSTASFAPQAWRIIHTRDTNCLSERKLSSNEFFMISWGGLIFEGVAHVDERKSCSLRP